MKKELAVNIYYHSKATPILSVINMSDTFRTDPIYDTEFHGDWSDDDMRAAIVRASTGLRPRKTSLWLGAFGERHQLYVSTYMPKVHNIARDDPGKVVFIGKYDDVVETAVAYARML